MLHKQAVRERDQILTLVLQRFGMFWIFQVHGVCLTCKESSALTNPISPFLVFEKGSSSASVNQTSVFH